MALMFSIPRADSICSSRPIRRSEPVLPLQLVEQVGDEVDVVDVLDLGDHQAVEPIAGALDHGDDVVEAPSRVAGVDPHRPHLAGEA